ncbi:MAG: hypothetical protein NT012_03625 [Candidatus Nealsonbacteria bacterium]|nr:hypothetical protein [Candidatus Nealsonbacteria bacterium]
MKLRNLFNIGFIKTKKYFSNNLIFYCLFVALIILPFFWFHQNLYLLGEDDTGLSYYNPLGTLAASLSSWFGGDALTQFQMPGGSLIFAFLLYVIKLITFGKINLQLLTFSFILSISFLSIVKILELLNDNKKSCAYYIAGLFYSLSAYFVIVEYYYLMPSTFVIVLAPILTFYLLKAIKIDSNKPLLIGAIWSLFLSRTLLVPVFLNFFALLFLFILIQSYFNYGISKIKYALLSYFKLIFFILAINAIILVPIFYSSMASVGSSISSAIADRTSNINYMVKALESEFNINKINDYFINLYPEKINELQGWKNYDLYPRYMNKTSSLMYIIVLLTFVGLITLPKDKRKIILPILILFVTTSLFLFVDVFEIFKRFFIYLIVHTPIFNMNRYPSMKFHIPFVFYYSLLVGTSLYYLFKKMPSKYSKIVFCVCLLVLITVNYSFISGAVFTENLKPIYTKRIMDFNDDYKKLVKDFPDYVHDDAKLLLFPLGYGYGAFITGQDESQIYRSTITGFKNLANYDLLGNLKVLGSILDSSIYSEAKKYYFEHNLQSLLSLAKKLNIKYIIYSKDIDSLRKYGEIIPQFTYNSQDYYSPVDIDKPVYENGGYSVYKIKNYNEISKFTSDDVKTEIYFEKVADFMYLLKIKTSDSDVLKMHEGFSKKWSVYKIKNDDFECQNSTNYAESYPNIYECGHLNDNLFGNVKLLGMVGLQKYNLPHEKIDNYINGWKINTNGEYEYFAIIMDMQRYYIIGGITSFLIFILYVYLIFKKKNIRKIS